jgi:hypothetical protein
MEQARYRLGPLHVSPWFALKDVAYVNNVFGTAADQKADFTATIGAGLHAYLPVGGKVIVGTYLLPEYVWWRDLSTRRVWNGTYGVGVFGYFNRVTLEARAGDSRAQQYASTEFEQPVNVRDQRASASLEVRVLGRFALFGRGSDDRWRYREQDLGTSLGSELLFLDRDEKRVGGGVRYRPSKALAIGVGVERITTEFVRPGRNRSNSGGAPLVELSMEGGHLRVVVDAVKLDLEPEDASTFIPYAGTTGHVQLAWTPRSALELQVYGGRNLVYSISEVGPYYVDERKGVGVSTRIGWRGVARLFWETGRDDYAGVSRTDDLKSYGAVFDFKLGRWGSFVIDGARTDYASSDVAFDRSVTRVQTSIRLTGSSAQWW